MSAARKLDTVRVNTLELTGLALDWAVGIAQKLPITFDLAGQCVRFNLISTRDKYSPTSDWRAGGALLAEHDICFNPLDCTPLGLSSYVAYSKRDLMTSAPGTGHLEAACRLVVLRSIGESMEIPTVVMQA
jgi:hypothetical protein